MHGHLNVKQYFLTIKQLVDNPPTLTMQVYEHR